MTAVPSSDKGFSLVELTAVIVVLGVLLAMAAPRMDGGAAVRELGFAERLLADLRFAQRRAQADGCEVRVAVTAGSVVFAQRAALCSGPFNRPVAALAAGGETLAASPPAGMALSATPQVFYFDGLGRVLDSAGGSPVDVSLTVGQRQVDFTGATGHASL